MRLGKYIKTIEAKILTGSEDVELGWETQLEGIRHEEKIETSSTMGSIVQVIKGEGYALGSTQLDRMYWTVASLALLVLFGVELVL